MKPQNPINRKGPNEYSKGKVKIVENHGKSLPAIFKL